MDTFNIVLASVLLLATIVLAMHLMSKIEQKFRIGMKTIVIHAPEESIVMICNTLNSIREILEEEALNYNSTPLYRAKHMLDDVTDELDLLIDKEE